MEKDTFPEGCMQPYIRNLVPKAFISLRTANLSFCGILGLYGETRGLGFEKLPNFYSGLRAHDNLLKACNATQIPRIRRNPLLDPHYLSPGASKPRKSKARTEYAQAPSLLHRNHPLEPKCVVYR